MSKGEKNLNGPRKEWSGRGDLSTSPGERVLGTSAREKRRDNKEKGAISKR